MKKKITLFLILFSTTILAEAQPTLTAGTAAIPQGGNAEISYNVVDFWNINHFNGTLTWDPAVLTFSSVSFLSAPLTAYPAVFNYSQTSAGILSFTWFHPISIGSTIANGNPVFKITFVASGSQGSSSVLGFSNSPEPIHYQDFSVGFGSYFTVNGLATIAGGGTNPPVANFSYGGSGLNWSFINSSTGSPTSYQWSFGDGNSSTQINPTHSYAIAGNYQVCLTASNANGGDSVCHMIYATGPPVASFTVSGTGLFHSFTNTSSGNPTSLAWSFGDGTTSTLQNPTHSYATYGTYQVCLTAVNANGNDSTCHIVYATMTVGVEDPEAENNPTILYLRDKQMIEIKPGKENNANVLVEVFSVQGQLLMSKSVASGSIFLPVYSLGNGVYFVRLTTGNKAFTRKLFLN